MKSFKLSLFRCAFLLIAASLLGCASMRLDYLETDTVDGPRQVRQGQNIDPKLITVWGVYKDGSRKVVSINSGNIIFDKHTPGPQTVKVRVSNQELSFQTEVMALLSFTIVTHPGNTLFKLGYEHDSSWPGLELRGEWDAMGSYKIDVADCEVTGYFKNQSGRQTIRVSYEGFAASFNVNVRSMASIKIVQLPAKLDYFQGEPLVLNGLKVMGTWEGFPEEELTITWDDVSGYNLNGSGLQRVTITKNDRSASFDVDVMALTSIIVDKPPTKTDYKRGEPLDITGLVVYGNYTGSDPAKRITVLIAMNQLVISGYDPNRVGRQQRVTVMVKGQAANFFVNIE